MPLGHTFQVDQLQNGIISFWASYVKMRSRWELLSLHVGSSMDVRTSIAFGCFWSWYSLLFKWMLRRLISSKYPTSWPLTTIFKVSIFISNQRKSKFHLPLGDDKWLGKEVKLRTKKTFWNRWPFSYNIKKYGNHPPFWWSNTQGEWL